MESTCFINKHGDTADTIFVDTEVSVEVAHEDKQLRISVYSDKVDAETSTHELIIKFSDIHKKAGELKEKDT